VSVSEELVLWNEPRRILVSFQAPHAGTFRMCLQMEFQDNTRVSSRRFLLLRELRGHATFPTSYADDAPSREPSPESDEVGSYHTADAAEEDDVLPGSEGTGISVSDYDGVDFGIAEREGLDGPFAASSFSITVNLAKGFPAITFVEARIRSRDGSDSW
jgi:hypothetical protein